MPETWFIAPTDTDSRGATILAGADADGITGYTGQVILFDGRGGPPSDSPSRDHIPDDSTLPWSGEERYVVKVFGSHQALNAFGSQSGVYRLNRSAYVTSDTISAWFSRRLSDPDSFAQIDSRLQVGPRD